MASIENNVNGRQRQWKTTSMEDNLNNTGRRPYWKRTLARLANQSLEDALDGRQPQWKMTSMEDDLTGRRP